MIAPEGGGARRVAVPSLGHAPPSLNLAVFLGVDGRGHYLALTADESPLEGETGPRWTTSDIVHLEPGTGRATHLGTVLRERITWSKRAFVRLLFAPVAQISGANGTLVVGRGDEPLVVALAGTGPAVAYAWSEQPDTVDRQDVTQWVRWRADHLDDTLRLPGLTIRPATTKPFYSQVIAASDGRIWVEPYRWYTPRARGPRDSATEWIILSPSDGHHGRIRLPPDELVLAVAGDLIAVAQRRNGGVRLAIREVHGQ